MVISTPYQRIRYNHKRRRSKACVLDRFHSLPATQIPRWGIKPCPSGNPDPLAANHTRRKRGRKNTAWLTVSAHCQRLGTHGGSCPVHVAILTTYQRIRYNVGDQEPANLTISTHCQQRGCHVEGQSPPVWQRLLPSCKSGAIPSNEAHQE